MGFRGLDFSGGINRYADLIRDHYKDQQSREQQEFQNRIAAQQASSLYGFEDPRVNNVPYIGPVLPSEADYEPPAAWDYPGGSPAEEPSPFPPGAEGASMRPQQQQRMPAGGPQQGQQPQGPDIEGMAKKRIAEELQKQKPVYSNSDRMILQLLKQPGVVDEQGRVSPYVAREIKNLMELDLRAQRPGLADELAKIMAKGEVKPERESMEDFEEKERIKAKYRPKPAPRGGSTKSQRLVALRNLLDSTEKEIKELVPKLSFVQQMQGTTNPEQGLTEEQAERLKVLRQNRDKYRLELEGYEKSAAGVTEKTEPPPGKGKKKVITAKRFGELVQVVLNRDFKGDAAQRKKAEAKVKALFDVQ